jgi:hypothetical protein
MDWRQLGHGTPVSENWSHGMTWPLLTLTENIVYQPEVHDFEGVG